MTAFDEKTARDLSWAEVLERLGAACFNDHTREVLLATRPFLVLRDAEHRQAMMREALLLLQSGDPLPMRRFDDLGPLWDSLSRGAIASAKQLRDTARLLQVTTALGAHLSRHTTECETLLASFATAAPLRDLCTAIQRAIDDDGNILDAASPALAAARHRLQKARREFRDRQQALLNRYADSLSGAFFAERDGRFVLPVRSDAPVRVEGFVLGASGSGATLYVEPRELSEATNRLRVDEARVQEEEEKVLIEFTHRLVSELPNLEHAFAVAVDADCVQSIATWADRNEARVLGFDEEPVLDLRAFRHPLLIDAENSVVPNDVCLRASQCLVLSGPNAGGKTVAMKCLGLAAWMSRAGFPLPCREESRVGWFDRVVTDIGDEQSLTQSLSTFSAHINNIARALQLAHSGSLVLLDELASGTDPDEGAALAAAILTRLVELGAAVCVTTHYERLKQLGASDDDRFGNAAVGFDIERLLPTFRLSQGVAGASAAFAVAARYGIANDVVEAARALMPKEQIDRQRVIEQLELERERLARARAIAEDEARAATRLRERLEQDKQRAFEQEQHRLRQEALELMQEVKQSRSLLARAKHLLAEQAPTKEQLREVDELISRAVAPVVVEGALERALRRDEGTVPLADSLKPGSVVLVPHLGAKGEVVEAPNKGLVRVSIGGLRMSVPLDKLRTVVGAKKQKPSVVRKPVPSPVAETAAPSRTSENTCDLRGMRVEQGLEHVEAFVDALLRVGEPAGFVLHGHGTGAMKSAVRQHLRDFPHVSHFAPASPEDGGDALTLFWLRG